MHHHYHKLQVIKEKSSSLVRQLLGLVATNQAATSKYSKSAIYYILNLQLNHKYEV